jgi:hypothetical protein
MNGSNAIQRQTRAINSLNEVDLLGFRQPMAFDNGLIYPIHAKIPPTDMPLEFSNLVNCNWLGSRVCSSLKSTHYSQKKDQGATDRNRRKTGQ